MYNPKENLPALFYAFENTRIRITPTTILYLELFFKKIGLKFKLICAMI